MEPKPLLEWTDDELERRVTRYEGNLASKLEEEVELTEDSRAPSGARGDAPN